MPIASIYTSTSLPLWPCAADGGQVTTRGNLSVAKQAGGSGQAAQLHLHEVSNATMLRKCNLRLADAGWHGCGLVIVAAAYS